MEWIEVHTEDWHRRWARAYDRLIEEIDAYDALTRERESAAETENPDAGV
jgi:hypothetical protein